MRIEALLPRWPSVGVASLPTFPNPVTLKRTELPNALPLLLPPRLSQRSTPCALQTNFWDRVPLPNTAFKVALSLE